MTAAAVVVGVSLVIIVVITAVLTRGWRNRVRRQPDETPQDRYLREISYLRRMGRVGRYEGVAGLASGRLGDRRARAVAVGAEAVDDGLS